MGDLPTLVLPALLGVILVLAGVEDARSREIANWKNAAIACLAPLWWWAQGLSPWPDVALQIGLALVVFGIFAAAFAGGWMGGGDVKMIGALALWLPFTPLISMLIVMSLLGGALTIVMVAESALRRRGTRPEVPYGVAIAIAALLTLREPIINHLG
jgi:prepilin peptidase CpaA